MERDVTVGKKPGSWRQEGAGDSQRRQQQEDVVPMRRKGEESDGSEEEEEGLFKASICE
jgi:hypothetical protein